MTWYNEYAAHPAAWLRFLIHFNLISPGEVNRKDIKRVKAIPKDAERVHRRRRLQPRSFRPMTYYNEFDPFAAAWLEGLIDAGHISGGTVDRRSIKDVKAEEVQGERVHLFAGIGGWDYALQLAGWPADRPVWTGSCPCQPFSAAGKRKGQSDDRHLWPDMHRLVRECRPDTIFGEQVASAIGYGWLDGVFADLEREGYACGAVVLGAHSVGAPHIRQRLFWVANSDSWGRSSIVNTGSSAAQTGRGEGDAVETYGVAVGRLGDTHESGPQGRDGAVVRERADERSPWSASTWHPCRDGKARRIPIEPALFPLAHGLPGRVGLLRGAGNALVPATAALFVQAFLESEKELRR